MSTPQPCRWAVPLLVLAAALALQWPLIFNPGYFSHDELQWAALASSGAPSPWWDVSTFQYRPLTFSIWMALSRTLFATPMAFHAVLVSWGSLNAVLLYGVGRGFGLSRATAAAGALGFVLTPYAAYTHGWVGCLADLIWLSCALLIALFVQRVRTPWLAACISAVLMAMALLAKEAAFAIPALLVLAWWFDGRKPVWLAALLATGIVAAVYLGLRWDALLHAPREGSQYTLSVLNLPQRWFEYQVFAPIPPLLEISTTLRRSGPVLVASLLWLGLLAALWRASRKLCALFLLGGIAALFPVLPLGSSWNHYAYGFAAITAMTIAAAWPQANRLGRSAILLFAALTALHGGTVMWRMQQVGRIQAVFSPALAQAIRTHPNATLTLYPAPDAKAWVFARLTHAIPAYDGVAIGERVQWVDTPALADYIIEADGQLRALR